MRIFVLLVALVGAAAHSQSDPVASCANHPHWRTGMFQRSPANNSVISGSESGSTDFRCNWRTRVWVGSISSDYPIVTNEAIYRVVAKSQGVVVGEIIGAGSNYYTGIDGVTSDTREFGFDTGIFGRDATWEVFVTCEGGEHQVAVADGAALLHNFSDGPCDPVAFPNPECDDPCDPAGECYDPSDPACNPPPCDPCDEFGDCYDPNDPACAPGEPEVTFHKLDARVVNLAHGGYAPQGHDDFPGYIVPFEAGFEEWGNAGDYPVNLEAAKANDPHLRSEYPRAFILKHKYVREERPDDDTTQPFWFEITADIELGDFTSPDDLTLEWSIEPQSVQAGRLFWISPAGGEYSEWRAFLQFDSTNPPEPGMYMIRAELKLPGETAAPPERVAVANYLLPYAGPEIAINMNAGERSWLLEEARQIVQPGGVVDQWRYHIEQLRPLVPLILPNEVIIQADDWSFEHRATLVVAALMFDYTGVATFNHPDIPPTRRYNFDSDDKRRSDDGRKDIYAWNNPSYATFNGRTIIRGTATTILATVWLRGLGYEGDTIEDVASAANYFDRGRVDPPSTRRAIEVGSELYDRIMAGQSDLQITNELLGAIDSTKIQTNDVLNDLNLWPMSDTILDANTLTWNGNSNLTDEKSFIRPEIFFASADEVGLLSDPRDRINRPAPQE